MVARRWVGVVRGGGCCGVKVARGWVGVGVGVRDGCCGVKVARSRGGVRGILPVQANGVKREKKKEWVHRFAAAHVRGGRYPTTRQGRKVARGCAGWVLRCESRKDAGRI